MRRRVRAPAAAAMAGVRPRRRLVQDVGHVPAEATAAHPTGRIEWRSVSRHRASEVRRPALETRQIVVDPPPRHLGGSGDVCKRPHSRVTLKVPDRHEDALARDRAGCDRAAASAEDPRPAATGSIYLTRCSPPSSAKSPALAAANVAKSVPCTLRQRPQWQWCIRSSGPTTDQRTAPQRQLARNGSAMAASCPRRTAEATRRAHPVTARTMLARPTRGATPCGVGMGAEYRFRVIIFACPLAQLRAAPARCGLSGGPTGDPLPARGVSLRGAGAMARLAGRTHVPDTENRTSRSRLPSFRSASGRGRVLRGGLPPARAIS